MSRPERTEADWAAEMSHYEGLVKKTAARYDRYVDDDYEDICATFRVTVWKAIESFSSSKSAMTQDRYVFSCIVNRAKDMLRKRKRDEVPLAAGGATGGGGPHSNSNGLDLEGGISAEGMTYGFEEHYFGLSEDQVYGEIVDGPLMLPATLTPDERKVVGLLYLHYQQLEIAQMLGFSRTAVERMARSIREKLGDWRPSSSEPGELVELPLPRAPIAEHVAA